MSSVVWPLPGCSRIVGAIVLLAAAVVPHPAEATPAAGHDGLAVPLVAPRLVAGSTTTIRWSRLPPEVEEFELLLSLDGGASYAVRLTPELVPATRRLAWQVPNLPVRDARLRLRVGVGGREIESPPSASFEIVAAPSAAAATLRYSAGEWWTSRPAGPSSPEPVSGERRWRRPGASRIETVLALAPDETHQLTFDPASQPVALPVAVLERPALAAWSDPSRPIAPTQRE